MRLLCHIYGALDQMPMQDNLADVVVLCFIVIPVSLVAALAAADVFASRRLGEPEAATRRALTVTVSAGVWMAITWLAAARGILRDWQATPPPFAILAAAIVTLACVIAFGPPGRRLALGVPLWALVAVQGFRLPLELAMHAMYERGVMPEQMSYSGWNFDIVTGATALVLGVAVWRHRAGRWLVAAWNVLGLVLLLNVVTIALVSTPRIQAFGPDRVNVWVTYPPFVWLPAVMVLAALAGHLVIFRALRSVHDVAPAR
jgi:hypothetical protein